MNVIKAAFPGSVGFRSTARGLRLGSQTAGNVGLNTAAFILNFVIAIILSRLLGADGYGAYAFGLSWAMLLAVPAILGLPSVVVREIAVYRVRGDWARARGLIRWANRAVVAASFVASIAAAVTFWVLDWPGGELFEPTLLALVLVPLVTVISIRQCTMQGFGSVVLGRAPEAVVAPVLIILFLGIVAVLLPVQMSAGWAMGSRIGAIALTALLGVYLLRRTVPGEVRQAEARDDTRVWLVAALPLFLMGAINAVNVQAGTILTGALAGSHEAGTYSVAVRVAGFLPFLFLAAVPPLMPTIAELHERKEFERLQQLLTRAARIVFVASLPLALALIAFAGPILGLFGEDFGAGVTPLRVLCAGQVINLATGFAGMILIMTGEAGQLTKAVLAGTVANLALSAALIPELGAEGAAVATATSMALANVLMAYLLWRRRRIYSPALGRRPRLLP